MPNRRKVLIGLGATVAIAGCSDTSETEPEKEEEETQEEENESEPEKDQSEQQDSEQAEAEIFISDIQPQGTSFGAEEEFELSVTYENRGERDGEFEVQAEFFGERGEPQTLQLDAGESETITIDIDASQYEAGDYDFTFYAGDRQESGSFTIEEPEVEDLESYSFTGSGESVEEGIDIGGGLTIIEASHSGESNFQVSLADDSQYNDNFINVIGEFDGAQADLIESGEYILEVNADGSWDIEIRQPRATSGESPPESLSGNGPDVIGPIEFDGTHIADGSHSGESNFQVQVYPMEGSYGETVFNEIGQFDGETTFSFRGVGWVDINADGDWEIDIE